MRDPRFINEPLAEIKLHDQEVIVPPPSDKPRMVLLSMVANDMGFHPNDKDYAKLQMYIAYYFKPVGRITPNVYYQTPELEDAIRHFLSNPIPQGD